jgi:lysophospholipase L1-like esterase
MLRLALAATVLSGAGFAQPESTAAKIQELEDRLAKQHRLIVDWGGLTHYGSDDSELKPPKPGENRVVFLGDQITEEWGAGSGAFFPGKPYLNRGIRGQTSPQMLVRFRQDVIALKPKVVVIQAGINDLAGATGPATDETIGENLTSMAELARYNGIRVVLASLTPICNCFNNHISLRLQEKIDEANDWIKEYADRSHAVYLDYFSALADGKNFRKELTRDGVLPNEAGYAVMSPLAEKAIAAALAGAEPKGVR